MAALFALDDPSSAVALPDETSWDASGFGGVPATVPISSISPSDPAYQAMLAGNAQASPVQSNSFGSELLGWVGLGATIAKTAIGAQNSSTRIVTKPNTTTSAASSSSMILLAVVLIVVLFLFIGRK